MKMGKFFVILTALFVILGTARIAEAGKFPEFSTTDLNGEIITNAIFAESDITMIYFWATWCPPCVAGKPVLAEMYEKNLERKGLIGILIDMNNRERAQQILSGAGAGFPQLRVSQEMESITRSVTGTGIPASIFVDSEGNIVGPKILGSRSSQVYLQAIQAAREEAY